ncbi:MAG: LysR family transcriptional regulator [Methylobacteriaceae bacterium]|jgi:DNA-binding transcriptional LysR family regulator|uniref:Transcriptional regulator, LysR family n=2 Tax=Methylorubrum extorquens TaxID=408 RepID=C7CHP4_METED|nr:MULTISPECIES: LysR family transcriptional regulator [Methylobacteriaceae]KQO85524.1 LysR family transcriptional regulator [Methylobacterium sp. Leaf92]KQO90125.1 LysR family transcriptional regulator [Methylobacterium sp. Leaf90]MBA9070531.1 DNA-binding transcriptional LysR family regulator [Methylobacterium sp. RAS18]KQQ18479.1 LysR family transcriptional regulator [Methylobacterium sp. Leaf122]MCG5248899.1 LysR family transcriptional regulator [Methylorubrum extorquens]
MFDWNDLTFFLELARHGRLMPAARRLKVDNTTVSRRIAELERGLDTKLFQRCSDGFLLTEAGHKLFVIAEAIEQKMLSVPDELGLSDGAEPAGRVRVASMEGIAAFYLSAKFAEFAAAMPGIVVELVTERHLINLTKREADISVSFVPPQGPRLKVRRVGEFRLALFGAERYFATHGRPTTRADLQDHDFVDYVDDLVAIEPVHWLLEVLKPTNVVFRSTSMAAQQTAVAAGAGLGLLPLFSAKTNPALIPVLADDVVVQRELYLGVHEDIEHAGRIRAVTRFLADLFSKEAAYLNRF